MSKKDYRRSKEPIWWLLFSAGGVMAAFLMPVLIVLTGFVVPAGEVSTDTLYSLMHHPLARLYLFLCVSLPLFHWAHRFRFTLVDLGMRNSGGILGFLFYTAAIVGTGIGGWLLWTL